MATDRCLERGDAQFRLLLMMIQQAMAVANGIIESLSQELTIGKVIDCQANVALPRVVLIVRQQIGTHMSFCGWSARQREQVDRGLRELADTTEVAWKATMGAVHAILLH